MFTHTYTRDNRYKCTKWLHDEAMQGTEIQPWGPVGSNCMAKPQDSQPALVTVAYIIFTGPILETKYSIRREF